MQSLLNDGVLAAKAVLLTLCAALGRESPTRFIIGPDEQPRDLESAAQYLSGLGKPVSCSATTTTTANAVRVSCVPKEAGNPRALDLTTAEPFLAAKSKTTGEADIFVAGPGESLRLTDRALDVWARDYAITLPFSIVGDDPTANEHAAGIRWVLRLGQGVVISTSIHDFDLSQEMKDIVGTEFERARRQQE